MAQNCSHSDSDCLLRAETDDVDLEDIKHRAIFVFVLIPE